MNENNWWFIIPPLAIMSIILVPELVKKLKTWFEKKESQAKSTESTVSERQGTVTQPPQKEKEQSYDAVAWATVVILGIAFVASIVVFAFSLISGRYPLIVGTIALVLMFIFGVVFYLVGWSIFKRILADAGIFYVRVPEMSAAFIEKDRKFHQVIITCSDPELRKHYRMLAEKKNKEANEYREADKHNSVDDNSWLTKFYSALSSLLRIKTPEYRQYVLTKPGEEVVFIGLPWIYRLRAPWYEHSDDAHNPNVEPIRYLNLKVRTIDYLPEDGSKPGGVVPSVDTKDPIQVQLSLVVEGRIWDPVIAVYGVDLYLEAVQKMIVSLLRRVVSGMSYLDVAIEKLEGDGKEIINLADINPTVQQKVYTSLNVDALKLARWEPINEDDPDGPVRLKLIRPKYKRAEVLESDGTKTTQIELDSKFEEESPAHDCVKHFGFILHNVEIKDLDPEQGIRDALNSRGIAIGEGAGSLERARRKAEEQRVLKDAEAYGISARAKALLEPGGEDVWRGDVAQGVASSTELYLMDGSGNSLAGAAALHSVLGNKKKPQPASQTDEETGGET